MLCTSFIAAAAAWYGAAEAPEVKLVMVREERVKRLVQDGFPGFPGLGLKFRMSGPAVNGAVKFGNLVVTEAADDTGAALIVADGAGFGLTNQPELKDVNEYNRNKQGIEFDVRLKNPARTAKSVSVKGTVQLIVGGQKGSVDIPGVDFNAEKELSAPELTEAGLKLGLRKAAFGIGKGLSLTIEGNGGVFLGLELVQGDKVIPLQKGGWSSFNKGPRIYSFSPKGDAKLEGTLRVLLLKGAETLTVPFAAEKLELP